MKVFSLATTLAITLTGCSGDGLDHSGTATAASIAVAAVTATSASDLATFAATKNSRSTAAAANKTATAAIDIAVAKTFIARGPDPKLALLSASCTRDVSTRKSTCRGSVKNISGVSMTDVHVVVEWAGDDEVVQTSNEGPIDENPLAADQESPWQVISLDNPALIKYSVRFRELTGARIPTRDDR